MRFSEYAGNLIPLRESSSGNPCSSDSTMRRLFRDFVQDGSGSGNGRVDIGFTTL